MAGTIIAALLRPTIANALLWSLGVHFGAAAASCYPWTRPLDRVSLAGTRNVVQVEMSIAAERVLAEDDVAVRIEPEPAPPVVEKPMVMQASGEPLHAVEPQPLPVSPTAYEKSILARRVAPLEPFRSVPSADSVGPVRREPIDITRDSAKTIPPRLPRREFDRPQISVTAAQIAGIDDTSPLELLDNVPPTCPAVAIARGWEGTVLLRLYIAATGLVERVEVVTSRGHDMLDSAAVKAVSQWRTRPAQRAGIAAATVELLPVRFRL